ncbi:class I SAM-dependent methyltransferase [Nanoarchaeota archaeon]
MKSVIERNREYSDKYFQKIEDSELPTVIKNLALKSKKIVDLGCGDGGIINSIININPKKNLTGVDISPRRIRDLRRKFPAKKFVCTDVCKTGLKSNFFDFVICSQVIEHVEDDRELVEEIDRISKKGAYIFVGSVIKKPWAVYKYFNNGKFVLDPTHEREYRTKEDFLRLFEKKFKLLKVDVLPVKRKKILTIRIPGYYTVEGLWRKEIE